MTLWPCAFSAFTAVNRDEGRLNRVTPTGCQWKHDGQSSWSSAGDQTDVTGAVWPADVILRGRKSERRVMPHFLVWSCGEDSERRTSTHEYLLTRAVHNFHHGKLGLLP